MLKFLFNRQYKKDKKAVLTHNKKLVVLVPEEDMIIKEVSNRKLDLIIKDQSPIGKFFTLSGFQIIAVDNSKGLAITKKFTKLNAAYMFLLGKGVTS